MRSAAAVICAAGPTTSSAAPWREAFGREAAQRLVDQRQSRSQGIDAIFCGSDQIARGVIDCLRETGVRVPDDIAVVGFDNWDVIAAATRPPITTVDMNLHELGRQAGLRLLDDDGRAASVRRRVPAMPAGGAPLLWRD